MVLDVQRDVLTSLPAGSDVGGGVLLWSPDGDWIYYSAGTEDGLESAIYRIAMDGSGAGARVSEQYGLTQTSITADGKRLYAQDGGDIVLIHLDEDSRVEEVITGPEREVHADVSPDGAWLAYRSSGPGGNQVYIRSADGQGGLKQVSRDGGDDPEWSPDGRKLYFKTGFGLRERTLMVVELTTPTDDEGGAVQATEGMSVSAADLDITPPRLLFDVAPELAFDMKLTPDGEGFLGLSVSDPGQGEEVIDEIIVVENFFLMIERACSGQNR